ncbi:MAG: hypothetical protein R3E58_11350 [Phycisphaerae bacterium]|nr:hypothetical protein [Phycisphaerales bacterium]
MTHTLTFDCKFKYTYDAWNRLVNATLDVEGVDGGGVKDVTIHEAAFDGLGRRFERTLAWARVTCHGN